MTAAPKTTLEILREVEAFLRGEAWFRGEVESWRFYGPDVDEDGGKAIHFYSAKTLDRSLENLGRSHRALAAIIKAEGDEGGPA